MDIDVALDYAWGHWWQLLLAAAGLLAVWLLFRVTRRRRSKGRIERALASSSNTLSGIRSKLTDLAEKKIDEYYQGVADPVNKMIEGILKATAAAASLEKANVGGIVRVCNHRALALALKKALHSLSENIVGDFGKVSRTLKLKLKMPSREESLKCITRFFSPVLVHFQPILAQMPEYEKALMATAMEFRSLAKPGFFRKVGYFFSSNMEKKDKARLSEIRKAWKEYLDLWKKVAEANEVALANLKALLLNYNMKLFVFTPCEALVKQVVKSKQPLGPAVLARAAEVA